MYDDEPCQDLADHEGHEAAAPAAHDSSDRYRDENQRIGRNVPDRGDQEVAQADRDGREQDSDGKLDRYGRSPIGEALRQPRSQDLANVKPPAGKPS